MKKTVTEWQILFSMTSDKEDFYTEDENEYKEYFQELKDNNELDQVEQCIKKTYVWNDETEDWEEDWVDVLYDSVMDLEKPKYNIYVTSGEDGVYNTTLYDTVDSEEQASDIVSELQAQGLGADYEKVEEVYNKIPKKLEENDTPEIVDIASTNGGYQNNATTLYGKLSDNTYFVYYTEMDLVETYDCEPDELIDILYWNTTHEDEMSDEEYQERYNEFFEQHNVNTYGPGDDLFEKLKDLWITDKYLTMTENKETNLKENTKPNKSYEIEYVVPNYTGGGIYVYTGKLKDGNYFIADDTYFGKEGDTFSPFDIRVVDTDPDKVYTDEDGLEYTLLDDTYYQEQHFVEDIEEDNAKEFTKMILQWVIDNKPEGNYQIGEMQEYLDIVLDNDTVEENLNEANNKINLEPLSNDLYKELVNIAELYYEDLDNEEDDTFAGTDDSYANEMLEQRLGDLITGSKAFYLWVSEHYDTTTLELKRKAYLDAYSKFMQIIKSNNLADYKQDKVKNESVTANNYGKDKSDFKRMLKTFDNNGKYAKRGNWEIGRGGYDLWYEISYNKVPVIGCTAGKVSAYQKGYEEYAKLVAEEYGDTYIDTLTEGKVTTTSGTYDTDKYDEICNKVKQAYKDTWAGKISYSDLEDIKKNSGLSSGELSSIQYMASRETDKKEETKQQENPTIKLVGKLSKDDTTFPIKLLGSNIFQYKDITVEEIFDSVKGIVTSYKNEGVNIEIVEQRDIDYNMLNTDFSHTTLTKYTLNRDSQVCYALEEFNGVGDEEDTTTYITNKEIPDNEINNFILALDEYYNKSFSTLKEETKQYNITDNTKFISYEPDMEGTYTMSDMKKVYDTKVSDEYKKEGSDFKDWLNDMLKSGVYEIKEAKSTGIFEEEDVRSYLTDIAEVVTSAIRQTATTANIELPTTGTLMNDNSVILYELPIIRFTGDKIGLGKHISAKLLEKLKSGKVQDIKCVPEHRPNNKEVYLLSIIGADIVKTDETKSIDTLEQKVKSKIQKVLQRPDFGFTEKDVDDYTVVEISQEDIGTKVQVRAELDYEAFEKLIDELNPIVQAYDKNSYFEMEEPGIASAILSTKNNKITEGLSVNETIRDLISQINKWFENNKIDKVVLYEETPYYGIVSTNVLDKELYDKYGTTAYETEKEQVFNQDGFGYEVIKYLENYLKTLKTNRVTEEVDKEAVQDNVEQEKQETGIKDDIDTEEEAKTATKKEVYQYAKQQGLDLEKLRKQGIELSEVAETLDKVIGNMVSKSIIEYEDKTGKSVVWDFEVKNNDIEIVISEI